MSVNPATVAVAAAVGCRPRRSASLANMSPLSPLLASLLKLLLVAAEVAVMEDGADVVLAMSVCSAAAATGSAVFPVALFMVLII